MTSHNPHAHGAAPTIPAKHIDPVCGMKVAPSTAAGSMDFQGTTYFFCGVRCLEKFRAAPSSFVVKPLSDVSQHQVEAEASVKRAEWTCPMHPEVVRPGPGSCPKCGMALEPRFPGAGEEDNRELKDMSRRFWFAVVLTVPLLLAVMGEMISHGAIAS